MYKVDVFVGPMIRSAATFRETLLNFRVGPSYTSKPRQENQFSPSGRDRYFSHPDRLRTPLSRLFNWYRCYFHGNVCGFLSLCHFRNICDAGGNYSQSEECLQLNAYCQSMPEEIWLKKWSLFCPKDLAEYRCISVTPSATIGK
jgi:hypothetical protein